MGAVLKAGRATTGATRGNARGSSRGSASNGGTRRARTSPERSKPSRWKYARCARNGTPTSTHSGAVRANIRWNTATEWVGADIPEASRGLVINLSALTQVWNGGIIKI